MSRARKIARRSFLIGSIAILGGVAFGGYVVTRPPANPLDPQPGDAALTPFVFIDPKGVTLIAPRAEMGQGVRTTLAALIAEELDVRLDEINVIHGPAAQAYYNATLLTGLPDYDAQGGPNWVSMGIMETLSKMLGLQVTGASTSIADAFVRFRKAGASARETLKEAAARRLGLNRKDLRTENGVVIAPDGTRFPYPALASEAAKLPVVGDVPLRDRSQWRYIGKPVARVDMVEKVTGTAAFSIDQRLEGMKFAAIRMNPRLGGDLASYNTAEAETMPGVERIIPFDGGIAVVATNTWLAQQAVNTGVPDWAGAPYPATTQAIFATIRDALNGDPNSTLRDDGQASVVPEGAETLEAEYRLPYLAHATMEPMTATAHFRDGRLTLWCGTQAPLGTASICGDALGITSDRVEVITTYMGGGFGRRLETDFAVYAALVAKAMPDAPVQLTWSREEDMTHDFYRPDAVARLKGAIKDGQAVLLDGQIASQSADFQFMSRIGGPAEGQDKVLVDGAVDQPYAIPNYRFRGYLAEMAIPVGLWRSVGYSVNGFVHDTFVDEMAHKAKADPLEFRYRLIKDRHAPSATTLETVRQMSDWTARTPEGVGMGVGFTYSFGTPVAIVIRVEDQDGVIHMTNAWIACDVGLAVDPGIVEAQMIGAMVYGLSAACYEEITFFEGAVEQQNFYDYDVLRMHTMPKTEVVILENNKHLGGAGEPGTPPSMPALGNALFDLTGRRGRTLPLIKEFNLAV